MENWRRHAGLAVALVLLTIVPALDVRGEDASGPLTLGALGIKGTAAFKNYSQFYRTNNDSQNFVDQGILQVEWARELARWVTVRAAVEARGDDDDFTDGVTFQILEKDKQRSVLSLREFVVRFRGGPVEATFGKQFFAWGTADAYNPTDLINPYDYMDVVDNEKIGVYSAAAWATAGPASLVFVVIPAFAPSRLPLPSGRWSPDPPPGFVGIVDNREVPALTAANMQYAARARATVKGVDLSVSYYDGFEHLPVLRQSAVNVAPGFALPRFTPVFARVKAPGIDFSTTYRKFEFHGEGSFRLVEANGRDDRFQWIAGSSYTWDELPVRWMEQIVFTLEYAREEILSSRERSQIVELGTLPGLGELLSTRAFRNALAARIVFKFNEETQLKLSGTLDLIGSPSSYLQPKITHKVTDALHAEAGLDCFTGSGQTFWGRWRHNARFFLLMKYFF